MTIPQTQVSKELDLSKKPKRNEDQSSMKGQEEAVEMMGLMVSSFKKATIKELILKTIGWEESKMRALWAR